MRIIIRNKVKFIADLSMLIYMVICMLIGNCFSPDNQFWLLFTLWMHLSVCALIDVYYNFKLLSEKEKKAIKQILRWIIIISIYIPIILNIELVSNSIKFIFCGIIELIVLIGITYVYGYIETRGIEHEAQRWEEEGQEFIRVFNKLINMGT